MIKQLARKKLKWKKSPVNSNNVFGKSIGANIIILYETLLDMSTGLRDYLWVNDDQAVALGRFALSIIPPEKVKQVRS